MAVWIALMAATPLVTLLPPARAGVSQVTGDWTVCGLEEYFDTIFEVDGNIIVGSAATCGAGLEGTLIVHDGGIRVVQDAANIHTVNVQSGGAMTLDTSFLTTATNQVDPHLMLSVTVSGSFTTLAGSWLKFPGTFTQSSGEVWFEDTTVSGFADSDIPSVLNIDANNDAPGFTVGAGTAYFVRSRIEDMWETTSAQPPTGAERFVITGTGFVTLFDTFVAVDFDQDLGGDVDHNYFHLNGAGAEMYAYNLTIAGSTAGRYNPPILVENTASAYILRFMNALVLDGNGVPVPNANLATVWARTGQTVNYPETGSTSPTPEILTILGRTSVNWDETGADGRARIPLWTDRLFTGTMPNSLTLGDFEATGSASGNTLTLPVSFPSYPDLEGSDSDLPVTFVLSGLTLPQPDLQVTSITFSPTQPLEGWDVTATVTVRNAGTGGASNIRVDTTDNSIPVDSRVLSFLAPGGSSTFTITLSAVAAGQHNLLVTLDPANSVRETNEANNQLTQGFSATPLGPDLAITVGAGPAYSGSPVTLTAVVSNVGDRATSSNVPVNFYRDSLQNLIGSQSATPVPPGNSTSVSIDWLPPFDATFTIIAVVDPANAIPEPSPYSEADNTATTTVSVIQVPNLVIESADLTLTEPFPTAGTGAAIQATVRNVGQVAANPSEIQFTLDGTIVGTASIPGLAPGASILRTSNAITLDACGLRTIGAWADSGQVISEGSAQEDDNRVARSVQVFPGGPDNITTYSGTGYLPVTSDVQTAKSWDITGAVTVQGASVTFVQGDDLCDKHFLRVRSGGSLTLDGATIQSNARFVISVEDTATLTVRSSALRLDGTDGFGVLEVTEGGTLVLEDSALDGDLLALSAGSASVTAKGVAFSGGSVHVNTRTTTRLWDPVFDPSVGTLSLRSDDGDQNTLDFDIRNVTFSDSLTAQLQFRGDQLAQLTSVGLTKPGNWWEGMLEDRAKASRYWWLEVRAVDGTGTLVPDAEFTVTMWSEPLLTDVAVPPMAADDLYGATGSPVSFPVTSPLGHIFYRARSEDRFANAPHWSNATYFAEGVVDSDGLHYPDANLSAIVTADSVIELVFSELTPDFLIEAVSFSGRFGPRDEQPVQTQVDVTIRVGNAGNIDTTAVTVYLYKANIDTNGDGLIDSTLSELFLVNWTTVSIPRRGNATVTLGWTPVSVESPLLGIAVDRWAEISETDETNNILVTDPVRIFPWPDLSIVVSDITVLNPVIDNSGTVRVIVRNVGTGTLADGGTIGLSDGSQTVTAAIAPITSGANQVVEIQWTPPQPVGGPNLTVRFEVFATDLACVTENCDFNDANNVVSIQVRPFSRPDLQLSSLDYPPTNLLNPTNFTADSAKTFDVIVYNAGQTAATNVEVSVYEGTEPLPLTTQTLASIAGTPNPLNPVQAVVPVTVTLRRVGLVTLLVKVDPGEKIGEDNENNNEVSFDRSVALPRVVVNFNAPEDGSVITPGQGFVVELRVEKAGATGAPLAGVTVSVVLKNEENVDVSAPVTAVTGGNGDVVLTYTPPDTLPVGAYLLEATVTTGIGTQRFSVGIRVAPVESGFPWWILIIVVIAIVAFVAVVVYQKVWGVGKMVECGNCGTFIAEDAVKCPNCGVEFEKDMAKCSNCQSWIPVDVKSCPECHVEFTTGEVEVQQYQDKMKQQYNEFRARMMRDANAAAGRRLTEKEFDAWWPTQPTHMTYEEWLREEEDMRKMGSRACPNCQTLNSVTARVCHKCGTVLEEPKGPKKPIRPTAAVQPKQPARPAAGGVPPKVVRRPGEGQPVQPVPRKDQQPPPSGGGEGEDEF